MLKICFKSWAFNAQSMYRGAHEIATGTSLVCIGFAGILLPVFTVNTGIFCLFLGAVALSIYTEILVFNCFTVSYADVVSKTQERQFGLCDYIFRKYFGKIGNH
jgi:hypothetical protein